MRIFTGKGPTWTISAHYRHIRGRATYTGRISAGTRHIASFSSGKFRRPSPDVSMQQSGRELWLTYHRGYEIPGFLGRARGSRIVIVTR